jgi:putative NIF3 family GTP cyclohydrolase 1 type 2
MKAIELYNQLEKDFVTPGIVETWYNEDWANQEYICDNFKQHSLGLLCDFTKEVNKVYTAVFPSDKALTKIISDGVTDAMLFVHHPLVWELGRPQNPEMAFHDINSELLEKLKENRVSLFNYHLPLDNFSEYSTSKTLAEAIGIKIEKAYGEFGGALCGIIGTTDCKDIHELNTRYLKAVGHETKLYQYGGTLIKDGKVGICAGGGNDFGVVKQFVEAGINTYIVGISRQSVYSVESHDLEKENGMNLLGGTHYSSEKYACIALCKYFEKFGILYEFISDIPCLADL